MRSRLWRFALIFAVAHMRVADGATGVFISPEDEKLAKELADSASESSCSGGFTGEFDEDSARKEMERAALGGNPLATALTEATSPEDQSMRVIQAFTGFRSISKLFPIGVAIIMTFFWMACCCQYQCKCCRCKARKRQTNPWIKRGSIIVMVILLAIIVWFGMIQAVRGLWTAKEGATNLLCTAKNAVSVLLNGQTMEPSFPGSVYILEGLEEVESAFKSDSEFATKLTEVGESPDLVHISHAGTLAYEQTELLTDFSGGLFGNPGDCTVCKEYESRVYQVLNLLKASDQYKIGRMTVGYSPISTADRRELQGKISETASGLIDLKNESVKLARYWVEEGGFATMQRTVNTAANSLLVLVILCMLCGIGLLFCGCNASIRLWLWNYKTPKPKPQQEEQQTILGGQNVAAPADNAKEEGDGDGENPYNPYSKKVFQWACRTWCYGFFFAILMFTFGGLLQTLTVPMIYTCLIMDDLEPSFMDDIKDGMSPDFNAEQTKQIIDGCLVGENAGDASLADILTAKNSDSTVRKQLVVDVHAALDEHYPGATSYTIDTSAKFSEASEVVALRAIFKRTKGELENSIGNLAKYPCNIFQTAAGAACDTKDMTMEEPYTPDCIVNNGVKELKKDCSRSEFATYLTEHDARLEKLYKRLDDTVEKYGGGIKEQIEPIMKQYIDDPLTALSDDATCGFMKHYWKEGINGLCFQGMVGVKDVAVGYIVAGVTATILIFVAYIIWRIQRDNYDHFQDPDEDGEYEQLQSSDGRSDARNGGTWLNSRAEVQDKPPDPSLIPESVRNAQ